VIHNNEPDTVRRRAGGERREGGSSLLGSGSCPNTIAKKRVNAGRHWEIMSAVLGVVR
jgi:hypothetical protein